MKALVTGGAGFVGSTIARRLLARGDEVRILDNLETGSVENIPSDAEFIEGDIRDYNKVTTAISGADIVFHQAAMVSVPLSVRDPYYCFEVNVQGTRNILQAAALNGCKRVVLASSAAIYGNGPSLPKHEEMPPACTSPYAHSKWLNELDSEYFSRYCSLETVCLRYFNVFGPRQRADSPYSGVISIATQKVLSHDTFTVFGTGEQTRDFVFVEDVANAAICGAIEADLKHNIYNVGRGESTSLLQLLELIGQLVGIKPRIAFSEARCGDVLHSSADVSRLREELRYVPSYSLREGLARTLDWSKNGTKESGMLKKGKQVLRPTRGDKGISPIV